ncbi:MAG: DUF5123 domain-containing protein [Anaerolineae bacterium]|nr:DUF5123 domain-containing protein [Anaerolineae bacterium]
MLSGSLTTDDGDQITQDYEPGDGIMLAVGDLGYGLDTGALSDVRIYQNVVHDVNVGCLVFWDELRETGRMAPGRIERVTVYNNVFYNCAQSRAQWGPGIILDASVDDVVIANNIIAGASDAILDAGAANVTLTHNLIFQAGDVVGTQTLTGDPLFVDPAAGDFRLQTSSPAVDAGLDVGLPFDGAAPDLGAFEIAP